MLGVKTIEGTILERKIAQVCGQDQSKNKVYQLKPTTGQFYAKATFYSPEQINNIQNTCRDYLHFFGYAKHPTLQNPTQYFEFTDQT